MRPTTLYVLRDNLIFQKNLKEKLALQGVDPLAMDGGVILGDAEESVGMIPPIVELDEEFGPCLIDGQHRSFLGREAGRKTMKVLYIAGANPEYPIYAYPNAWEDVAICDSVPEKKKHYRMEDPAFLYRDFSALNGSSMRPVA